MGSLDGLVSVVTGASRGGGRGVAVTLGEAGATVYVTGRSARGGETTEGLPGTVEDTADEVTRRGGIGIPVRCDHTVDADVAKLFDRVRREHGGLGLLVSNAWGGYEHYGEKAFVEPFWKQPLDERWNAMFVAGVRAHFLASSLAAPLMIERGRGLIILTTSGDGEHYLGALHYDVAKAAVNRMAAGMAYELRRHNVAAIALAPGFMRTERVLAAHAAKPFNLSATESPEYVGRAVVALAADPDVMRRSGKFLTVGEAAKEYGFTDIDGRYIAPFRLPNEYSF